MSKSLKICATLETDRITRRKFFQNLNPDGAGLKGVLRIVIKYTHRETLFMLSKSLKSMFLYISTVFDENSQKYT